MPKTALGLFENPHGVEDIIREVEALGLPRSEIRTLAEPATFEITSQMSFPRLDFEVDLRRELTRFGVAKDEIEAYVEGLRRGGTLVFATGPDDDGTADAAAEVMNRHGAVEIREAQGPEPHLPRVPHANMASMGGASVLEGRVRQPSGACIFVW